MTGVQTGRMERNDYLILVANVQKCLNEINIYYVSCKRIVYLMKYYYLCAQIDEF